MPAELEKKSLEMHVEMDQLRQEVTDDRIDTLENTTESKLAAIEKKLEELVELQKELKKLVDDMKDDRNDQLIKWGTAIIVALFSALAAIFLKIIVPIIIKAAR